MTVFVGERGQLQAFRAGVPDGIYYRPDSTTGDAGFFLAVRDGTPTVYGFDGNAGPHGTTDYTLGSQGAVTGSGTAADPLKQMTIYRTAASNGLEVTQTTIVRQRQPVLHHHLGRQEHRRDRRALQGLRGGRLLLRRQRPRHRHLHPGPAAVHRRHERRHGQLRRLRRGSGHHGVVALPGARVRQRRQRGVGQDRQRGGGRRADLRRQRRRRAGRQRRRRRVGPVRHGRHPGLAGCGRLGDLLARRAQRGPLGAADQPAQRRLAQGRADQLHRRCLRHQRHAVRGQDHPLRDHRRERDPDDADRDGRPRRQRGDHRSGHQRGPRHRGRLPGLQQQRDARARRASGLGAGDLRRQRPALVQASRSAATGPAAAAARASR